MPSTIDSSPALSAEVSIELTMPAPADRVWRAIVEEIDDWWPAGFFMTPEPHRVFLEARPGGRLAETSDSGAGLLWYTVVALDPPGSIQLAGHVFPAFGGPATSFLHIRIDDGGDGTSVLSLTDSLIGRIEADNPARIEQGWRSIFQEALRTHLAD